MFSNCGVFGAPVACTYRYTLMHRPFKCCKHTEVQAQCTQCGVLWCAARRVRAYWIHLCCLQLLVCAHQPGQTFLSCCQHHLRQNNHYVITLTKPFSSIPCTLNFLVIHTSSFKRVLTSILFFRGLAPSAANAQLKAAPNRLHACKDLLFFQLVFFQA